VWYDIYVYIYVIRRLKVKVLSATMFFSLNFSFLGIFLYLKIFVACCMFC